MVAWRAQQSFTFVTGAERAAGASVTDRTPFKDQTGEGSTSALFLSLSRRWLELFHESNFASLTQM